MEDNKIYVYCDGACRNNQSKENIGGYGVVLRYKDKESSYYGAEKNTTNNKMELSSLIVALGKIKDKSKPVVVTMDSQYVIKGLNEWSKTWKKNGFKNSKKQEIENIHYWRTLLDFVDLFPNIQFIQCEGHAENEGNNLADKLANKAMDELENGENSNKN